MQPEPNRARLCLSKTKSSKAAASRKVTLTTKAPLKPGSPTDSPHCNWCTGSRLEDVTPAGEVTACEVQTGGEEPWLEGGVTPSGRPSFALGCVSAPHCPSP